MKESNAEGLTSHGDPESCVDARKDVGEAFDRGTHGRNIEPRKQAIPGADAVELSGRPHNQLRNGERLEDPARSKTSSTCGNSMRENREIPPPPSGPEPRGRVRKGNSPNLAMHGRGKSDSSVLPTKPPNKAGQPAAEMVEGRGLTKENASQTDTSRTQSRANGVPSIPAQPKRPGSSTFNPRSVTI